MSELDFKINNLDLLQGHYDHANKQHRFAFSKSLNLTLKSAQSALQSEIIKTFDNPTNWVKNSVAVLYSNVKQAKGVRGLNSVDMKGKTWLMRQLDLGSAKEYQIGGAIIGKDEFGWKGYGARQFLAPHIVGGYREDKRSEALLKQRGLLKRNQQLVPTRYARKNKYGNITGGSYTKMLAAIGALNDRAQNSTNSKRANYKKFFFGTRYGLTGIFENRGGNKMGVALRKPPLMWLMAVDKGRYRARLSWGSVIDDVLSRELTDNYLKELEKALETAK